MKTLMLLAAALFLSGCATQESVRLLNKRLDSVRVEARESVERAYAMATMSPAEAESARLGARDLAAIRTLRESVARAGYKSCQADFKDLKEYVEDLQSEAAALRAANAELRKQVESCRNNAGRIDGYWRKAQDEAIFEKASREAAEETNKKLQFQINALLAK